MSLFEAIRIATNNSRCDAIQCLRVMLKKTSFFLLLNLSFKFSVKLKSNKKDSKYVLRKTSSSI